MKFNWELIQGNCLEVLDKLFEEKGEFVDLVFCDPPYFLSNGGITCQNGKMVKVDKGDWDKSEGPKLNHEFNTEWLKRCQKILKPNGTITAQVGSQDKKPKQVDKWLNLFEKSFGNTSLDRIYIPSFDCSWNFASSINK